jgi:transposase-like protein
VSQNAGDPVSPASIQESRGVPFMNNHSPIKWRHFEADIILLCARWYLRYSLSYRDLAEMMRERGLHAATHFFVKALHSTVCSAPQARPAEEQMAPPMAAADRNTITPVPRVINVDKHAAYPKASRGLPESAELRQVKYLNNIVEQDHRFIKRLVKRGVGFFSFETADRTLQDRKISCIITYRSFIFTGDLKNPHTVLYTWWV